MCWRCFQPCPPELEELLATPHGPGRTWGCSCCRHGGSRALGKGLMLPACSVATPVQPESKQSVSASVQRGHTLSLAEPALQREHTPGRDHRHWGQPQAPLLSATRATHQATIKKTKRRAGEGAGAPCEFSALSVTGTAAGHVVLPGLAVSLSALILGAAQEMEGKAPSINCWGQVSVFFKKTCTISSTCKQPRI